jgi:hypothetical protein
LTMILSRLLMLQIIGTRVSLTTSLIMMSSLLRKHFSGNIDLYNPAKVSTPVSNI